jgi:hypothetical protein
LDWGDSDDPAPRSGDKVEIKAVVAKQKDVEVGSVVTDVQRELNPVAQTNSIMVTLK